MSLRNLAYKSHTYDDTNYYVMYFALFALSPGVLTVRPLEEKGSQLVRRDTMVFFVVRGKIAMTLHQTSHLLQNGDWFFVPKGKKSFLTDINF